MTDPSLTDRVLADQLDGHMPPYRIIDIGTARAAAVRLRKLDEIEAATRGVDWGTVVNLAEFIGFTYAQLLRRIAGALGETEASATSMGVPTMDLTE